MAIDRQSYRSTNHLKMVEEDHATQMAVSMEQHYYYCSVGRVGDTVPLRAGAMRLDCMPWYEVYARHQGRHM